MCSIAFPGVFSPQYLSGAYYMDGGAANVVPFDIIRNACDALIAVGMPRVRPNSFGPSAKKASMFLEKLKKYI